MIVVWVGCRELLVVDRDPWALTLYRLESDKITQIGQSTLDDSRIPTSNVVPMPFRLLARDGGHKIEVVHQSTDEQWLVSSQ